MGSLAIETPIIISTISSRVAHGHAPVLSIIKCHAHTLVGTASWKTVLNSAVAAGLTQVTSDLRAAVEIGGTGVSHLGGTPEVK